MDTTPRRVAFYTLGCKLNFSETSTIARHLTQLGYKRVPPTQQADLYVINSCSVTENADRKCRQAIHHFHTLAPEAKIVVTGCYAQLKPMEIAEIKGVTLVAGAAYKAELHTLINANNKEHKIYHTDIEQVTQCAGAYSSGDRTRSFLKVQDGCNYRCSYCTIPLARGASRNLPIEQIVEQAQLIANQGIKEIIITGVNTGDFGRTTGENFIDLLRKLQCVNGIERYRISSIEPNLISSEVIELVASSQKFLPHFHIPLQSGSNRILGLMRRRYNRELFAAKLTEIRKAMPHAFIGVDVIVGFPTETHDDFMDTYNLLNELKASYLHIFPYSARPNTPAVIMSGQIDSKTLKERTTALGQLSKTLHQNFCQVQLGSTHQVLFEASKKNGLMFGFTGNYIKVATPYNKKLVGTIVNVNLGHYQPEGYCEAKLLI